MLNISVIFSSLREQDWMDSVVTGRAQMILQKILQKKVWSLVSDNSTPQSLYNTFWDPNQKAFQLNNCVVSKQKIIHYLEKLS